jgi:hypothetical protein
MTPLAAKILIFGLPLLLSLSWFLFWVIRLARAGRRLKSGDGSRGKPPEGGSEATPTAGAPRSRT